MSSDDLFVTIDSRSPRRIFFIDATSTGHPGVVVIATYEQLYYCLKTPGIRNLSGEWTNILRDLEIQIKKEDVLAIREDSDKWKQFCDAIVLCMSLRKELYHSAIPMIPSYIMNTLNLRICIRCGQGTIPLLACSKCKVKYCSAECQRLDWPLHKTECTSPDQQKEFVIH
jgi:hypothetical protein